MIIKNRCFDSINNLKGIKRAIHLISGYVCKYEKYYVGLTEVYSNGNDDIHKAIEYRLSKEDVLERKNPDKVIAICICSAPNAKNIETRCIKHFKPNSKCLNKASTSGISADSDKKYVLYLRLFK